MVDDGPAPASSLKETLQALPGVTLASSLEDADVVVLGARAMRERLDVERRLRDELAEAKARLAERKDVERAKGILMQQRGLTEGDAFAALRSLAMLRGIRLGEAARQVIQVAALLR